MVDKVSLSESLLKILTSLWLESACIRSVAGSGRLMAGAGARPLGRRISARSTCMLLAHYQIVCVDLTPLCWLHQLVCFCCSTCVGWLPLWIHSWTKLRLEIVEQSLTSLWWVLPQQWLDSWCRILIKVCTRWVNCLGVYELLSFCRCHLIRLG